MQIKLEEFNNCPGAEELRKDLASTYLDEKFEVADAKAEFWQNEPDTLVLKYIGVENGAQQLSFSDGALLGRLAGRNNADEFDWIHEDYELYIRLWWD